MSATLLPCCCFTFIGRAGKEVEKRNLTLVDDTCTEISLTLWGASAKQDGSQWESCPVVAFKGVKVRNPALTPQPLKIIAEL